MVEFLTTISIIALLLGAGTLLAGRNPGHARRSAVDAFTGMVERARVHTITTSSYVILGIAEYGDLPTVDSNYKIGLFQVDAWPDDPDKPIHAKLMSRWQQIESGVVFLDGETQAGLSNPLNAPELAIVKDGSTLPINMHSIAFNSRGVIVHPPGSKPITIRIAEGSCRHGKATPILRGAPPKVTESQLKIGRLNSRSYRIDL